MESVSKFRVFGEEVELLVTSEMTRGASVALIQTSPPGGGPPPHLHDREDEMFYVLEGEYEKLFGVKWSPIQPYELVFVPRGVRHTFRNSGTTQGKVLAIVAPGGIDHYLKEISALSLPADMVLLNEIASNFGVVYL